MTVALVALSLLSFISLIIPEGVIDISESLCSVLNAGREFTECVIVTGVTFKSQIPYGVDISWIRFFDALDETELDLKPA